MKSEDIKELKKLANKIGRLFRPFIREKCSDCPRAKIYGGTATKERGCCSECGSAIGYLRHCDAVNIEEFKNKYKFNKKDGFFDIKRKTCKLPRWQRSFTCLTFSCDHKYEYRAREITNKIRNIRLKYVD